MRSCRWTVDRTRLLSRNRVWARRTLRSALTMLASSTPAAFLMTRKMLLGIKRRAEASARLKGGPHEPTLGSGDRNRACRTACRATSSFRTRLTSLTHAITVNCSRRELWPWLVQMGADRAGWYSYDLLDNGGRHSAEEILREFQNPAVGAIFPALPGRRDGFVLIEQNATTGSSLGGRRRRADTVVTWAFVLREIGPSVTQAYRPRARQRRLPIPRLPNAIGSLAGRLVHFIMERKQLVEIARRAERRVAARWQ